MGLTQQRSPRYPRYSITEALEFASKLYEGAHRSPVSTDTAYIVMGFSGKSGSSASALGAIRQFALVDGLRGDIKISDLAMRILEPSSRQEYIDAVIESASKPEVFEAIISNFGGILPKSDEPIKSFLIRTLSFSKMGAEECLQSLRNTFAEVERLKSETHTKLVSIESNTAIYEVPERVESEVRVSSNSSAAESEHTREMTRIQLSRDCVVEMRFIGTPSDRAFERLVRHINLLKEAFEED